MVKKFALCYQKALIRGLNKYKTKVKHSIFNNYENNEKRIIRFSSIGLL